MEFSMEMSRRAMLERAMLLVGATVAVGGCKLSPGDGADPNFKFAEAQYRTLTALADTLLPKGDSVGALDAKAPAQIEGLIRNWASKETREKLLGAIDEVGALGEGGDFAALDPAARAAALKPFDAAALENVPPPEGVKVTPPFSGPFHANPGYSKLRQLIVFAFYYSQAALTEELPYEHNPGRWDASVPVTPETRNAGGLGFM
ncbi:MAG: gluconate 2-dehydrogenase subunit 3 family protein [Sphingomonadaceae bacterium]